MNKLEQTIERLCPDGTEYKLLTDVAFVKYGYPFKSEFFTDDDSCIPLIRIRDIIPAKASTYYKGSFGSEYIVHAGDILVGMDGSFNVAKWNDRDGILNQRVCRLETKDKNVILNEFLFHLLTPTLKAIENSITASTAKHLSAKLVNQIRIPVPPMKIQKEIVSILDPFMELEAMLEAELEARKTQYIYYRDKLLTFKEKTA